METSSSLHHILAWIDETARLSDGKSALFTLRRDQNGWVVVYSENTSEKGEN